MKFRENWIHAYSKTVGTVITFDPTGSFEGDLSRIQAAAYSCGIRNPGDFLAEAEGVYDFSASRSSSIYGSSTTVQPASVTVRRFIKAA